MQEPDIVKRDAQAYYQWLRSQRIPGAQAYQMVVQRFGEPKSQGDLAAERQKAAENAGLAQAGGAVAGTLGTAYLANQIFAPAATTAAATGAATGAVGAGTGATVGAGSAVGAGTAGAGAGAGAGASAGAGAGAGSAGASAGSGIGASLSMAGPVAAVVMGASEMWEGGMKDILRGRGNRQDWTNFGINAAGGVAPNIVLRWMGKPSLGRKMTTGKSDAQLIRDDFRGDLKETGVADDNYHVTLADGSKFNIGLDGKTKYTNVGENVDGKKTRNAWDVDWSNPLAKLASDKIDPMIRRLYGEDNAKAKFFPSQYTGMLVNAVTSNAQSEQDVLANIEAVLGKSKFAQEAGVGTAPVAPTKAPKGQVVRVSPGMYVNDKGHVGPAKTVRESLEKNYKKTKEKEKK